MNEDTHDEGGKMDEPIGEIKPRFPLSGTPGEILTIGESTSEPSLAEAPDALVSDERLATNNADSATNDSMKIVSEQASTGDTDPSTVDDMQDVDETTNEETEDSLIVEDSVVDDLLAQDLETRDDGPSVVEVDLPVEATNYDELSPEPTGGPARVVVAILSVVLLILGLLILIGMVEMPLIVGVFLVASGAGGIALQALPIIARLGVPTDSATDPSHSGLNR